MGQKSFQYRQFAVEEEHVTAYVQHMEEQKACALIRASEKKQRKDKIKQKPFSDYDRKKHQAISTL